MIKKNYLIDLIVDFLKKNQFDSNSLLAAKRKYAQKGNPFPKNSQILTVYRQLVKEQKISPNKDFEKLLRLKKIRSLSGIIPVAVLTKPFPCPGKCVYCPTQQNMPKSYLDDEPAVMRAALANFDPYLQVKRRLKQLYTTGHAIEKIELIVMGGTFTALPKTYQKQFIKRCFDAVNNKKSKNLKEAQKINETAKKRIIGITLETRPDEINEKEIEHMRQLGATRVEIGVQSIFDDVLKRVKRGHKTNATIKATKLLKDAGFKVCYHLMPNLPGSNFKKDLTMFEKIFTNENFMPDMIKIYPCVVTFQAELYKWYKDDKFKPYTDKQLISLLLAIKKIIPPWVRINRLGRDIPIANIAAGTKISNIRQVLAKELKKQKTQCQCIRCREIKESNLNNQTIKFNQIKYQASGGEEYFLQYINNKNELYTLLRLRIPSQVFSKTTHFIPELGKTAIIRELHTYGQALPINKKDESLVQHKGLGKKLLKKAEEIVLKKGIKKISVISGIGVRQYYKNLGYHLEGSYMIKKL